MVPGPTAPTWSTCAAFSYWKDGFDWRAQEAALNAYPQFKIKLHDIDVHYLHVPGKGPSPTPLLLMRPRSETAWDLAAEKILIP
jgi:microsomal epoxide hydrolase